MSEQLILKGTLEGHVSLPILLSLLACSQWVLFILFPPLLFHIFYWRALFYCFCCNRVAGLPAWRLRWRSMTLLPHMLSTIFGSTHHRRIKCRGIQDIYTNCQRKAPTCFFPVAETRPSSSGTWPAMRVLMVTQSALFTAILTSSPTVYVKSDPRMNWGMWARLRKIILIWMCF